jgi:hypothetical protein
MNEREQFITDLFESMGSGDVDPKIWNRAQQILNRPNESWRFGEQIAEKVPAIAKQAGKLGTGKLLASLMSILGPFSMLNDLAQPAGAETPEDFKKTFYPQMNNRSTW